MKEKMGSRLFFIKPGISFEIKEVVGWNLKTGMGEREMRDDMKHYRGIKGLKQKRR
jgi:hypothetical protein